ncbi:histone-lysine N-methyltransferase trithorax [Anopheles aquasalis]|uniref:histone-lysine N-methyltransferase trithorax n=1 Tax=Anopheles aquasalis TaxID=42839 RepID=UPI00215B6B7B|nr:histone-lysine N-methyltransferase trithorax [Anopheles aquasalis]
MGKSKFPGKPSRLVNKKRVSVLSPAGLTLSDEDNQEGSIQQQMLATAASSAVAAAGSPSPTRPTCEKPSTAFPLQQRKESTAASSGTAAVAAAKSSSSLENGRHGDNDDDVHQLAASKNGASQDEAAGDDDDGVDGDGDGDADEGNEDDDEDDEEEEEEDDEEEDDDEDDDDEDEEEEDEEEEEDDGEEQENDADHGGGAGDECSRTRTATTTTQNGTTSSSASSGASPSTAANNNNNNHNGASEVRANNGGDPNTTPEPHSHSHHSTTTTGRNEKLLPVAGNGFEMKPSSLTSALARRGGTSGGAVALATARGNRQHSPAASSLAGSNEPSPAGSSEDGLMASTSHHHRATTRAQKSDTTAMPSTEASTNGNGDSSGSSSSNSTDVATPAVVGGAVVPSVPPVKKKSVTFHTTLETTDENIVKKVYNPDTVPLASIIKKECLARPIRLKKSFNRKMKKRLQRAAMQAAAAAANAAASTTSILAKPAECIVRPSRLTGIVLKSTSTNTGEVNAGGLGFAATATPPNGGPTKTNVTDASPRSTVAFAGADDPPAEGSADSTVDTTLRNLESGGTQFGDKRFILPKRSAHSSRVIKPNKRFLDEFELEIKKKNKNLAAAAAVAAAAAAASAAATTATTSSHSTTAGSSSTTASSSSSLAAGSSQAAGTQQGKDGGNETESSMPVASNGEESRKRKDKKRSEDSSDKSAQQNDHRSDGERSLLTPISINPFAKTSPMEGLGPGQKMTLSQLVKPSQLSPASGSGASGLSTSASNPTNTNLSAAASIFGKSILRQPRLQFATSLLNSGSTVTGPSASSITSSNSNQTIVPSGGSSTTQVSSIPVASPITNNTITTATTSEGLFTMHLKAKAKLDSSKLFTAALGVATAPVAPVVGGIGSSCNICGIPANTRYYEHPTKKYGVSCCDVCRKFISKMVKKLANSASPSQTGPSSSGGASANSSSSSSPQMLKCKNEGKCLIAPPVQLRTEPVKTRHVFKERCHACWLRRCLGTFQLPTMLKVRLGQTLPLTMRTLESISGPTPLKKDTHNPIADGNLFASTIAESASSGLASGGSGARILWNAPGSEKKNPLAASVEFSSKSSNPFLALPSNALSQNNSTFGSLPQIKLTLGTERSAILSSASTNSTSSSNTGSKSPLTSREEVSNVVEKKDTKLEDTMAAVVRKESKEPETESGSVKAPRTRSKSEAVQPAVVVSPTSATVSSVQPGGETSNAVTIASATLTATTTSGTATQTATTTTTLAGSDKRQRIDLKGPRVKHVCRSASIVLGQPLATFPDDVTGSPSGGALENIETPPSDSAAEPAEDLPLMDRERRAKAIAATDTLATKPSEIAAEGGEACGDCIDPSMALSPPATPDEQVGAKEQSCSPVKDPSFDPDTSGSTEKELVIDEDQLVDDEEENGLVEPTAGTDTVKTTGVTPSVAVPLESTTVGRDMVAVKKQEQQEPMERPTTRKATSIRPQASKPISLAQGAGKGPANISGRKQSQSNGAAAAARSTATDSALVSIDFWENYDPAEVSRTGFGLILSESVPVRALCFLCGSAGLEDMLFCVCCCEPYHQYCVKDEYNLRAGNGGALDDTLNVSLLDVTLGASPQEQQQQLLLGRFNWMCPRCTVCFSCNMATGSKVKCQKCAKYYHTTCLGTSKRLHGADRPLICADCLRCKSCSTTNVTKFIGNLPMCTPCFRLRQKGNYCPLCQKCYEDNDFDLKMMECGDCRRWVHARCEGLTDEQYNMLSVLPENIEFICKKCGKHNETANMWRDAVAAEFKAGLLSVVKLLSKSRQACALLKLSPRKKTPNCSCGAATTSGSIPITGGKNISFFAAGSSGSGRNDSDVSLSKKPKLEHEDSIYDFNSENSCGSSSGNSNAGYAVVPAIAERPAIKCFCSLRQTAKSNAEISLVEIKQKINANEYYSLQDFHYDMNTLLGTVGSEELSVAYKEFLSETFPWFQNETKACTDALEEAMCGEVSDNGSTGIDHRYNGGTGSSMSACGGGNGGTSGAGGSNAHSLDSLDQKVPQINVPLDELADYFHDTEEEPLDTRICMLCKQQGEGMPLHESRLLFCGQNNWVHINCALWSAEVFEEIDGSLQNVHSAASRGRLIKCCHCGVKGATVGCNVKNCGEHYHFPCARRIGCVFMLDKTLYCPAHASEAKKKRCPEEKNFEIARSVYVELDRRKKRFVEPARIQFMIGALHVRRLGHIVPMFSDQEDVIIPTDFECSRLYWSSKEPWKIVSYRIKTSIQSNNYCYGTDLGKNFTVDHSSTSNTVQWGLTQIARWHNSLQYSEDGTEEPLAPSDLNQFHPQHSLGSTMGQRPLKSLETAAAQNAAVCSAGDDTNDEEPQNTNDLLPPEIKDVIFEDLPHDILDGISMLDILPKLMTYEDLLSMDLKTDTPFSVDLLKEVSGGSSVGHGSSGPAGGSSSGTRPGHAKEDGSMEVGETMDENDLPDAIGGGTELSNDSWMKAAISSMGNATVGGANHGVEDALLSAIVKPSNNVNLHRELKRSKSDILARGTLSGVIGGGQQQHQHQQHQQQQQQQQRTQRSGSFSWNTKQLVESNVAVVAKRRKIAKNNLKLSDVLSLGRLKEDTITGTTAVVLQERRKSLQIDEFQWATAKKSTIDGAGPATALAEGGMNVFEKLKISQLDGVDDICLDGGGAGGQTEMKIYSSRSMVEAPVKCDRCQATYRNQESYQRHLSSCEVLSTSESESETRSPRLLSPEQQQQQQHQQIINTNHPIGNGGAFILPQAASQPQTLTTTDIYGNTTGFLSAPQSTNGPTISVLQAGQTINLNGNQAILSNLPTSLPITINQLQSGIPIQTSATGHGQQIPLQSTLQAAGLQNLGGNMIISAPGAQGQLFATTNQFTAANGAFQQQQQDSASQQHAFVQSKQRFIQPAPSGASQTPQTLNTLSLQNSQLVSGSAPNGTTTLTTAAGLGNVFTAQQPQIISFGPNGQPQLMTIAPQQQQQQPQQTTILQQTNTQSNGGHSTKKHVIYPAVSPSKKPQILTKLSQHQQHHLQQQQIKSKRSNLAVNGGTAKTMQIKTKAQEPTITIHPSGMVTGNGATQLQTIAPQQQQQQQIQLINTSYPLIRPAATPTAPQQTAGNIIFQQSPNQPILVQQVGGNQISYLSDQGTLTSSPVQYQLAPTNVLTQNGFAMTTAGTDPGTLAATTNNILIPNGTGGYSLIPAGALQIAQPQVIGTIVQPQATAIQCGMMATEQMVLGAAAPTQPTLEMMVTDPASGCMYLTSPSVYYGLETIVQNTVMSSQQFVSTAMQGVLSQNSSFSATTTQVFAASKIEPIVEMPTSYVVLNNDNTSHSQTQQIISSATSQATTPVQMQTVSSATGSIFHQAQPTATAVSSATSLSSAPPSGLQHVWKLDSPAVQSSAGSMTIQPAITTTTTSSSSNCSSAIVTPLKATMKTIIPKSQPQLVNKVMPNTAMKVQLTSSSASSALEHHLTTANVRSSASYQSIAASSVYTTATALTTTAKVSNIIKPITKTTNYGKPKIVAKPVKQKQPSTTPGSLVSPPAAIQAYQITQQQPPFVQNSISLVPTSGTITNQPHLVPIKPSITSSLAQSNQMSVSAIKQPTTMEKTAAPTGSQSLIGSGATGNVMAGQMLILPSNNGVKGAKLSPNGVDVGQTMKGMKKQDTKLLTQKPMPLSQSVVPPVQMISFTSSSQQQQQQAQQPQQIVIQQPFQQMITSNPLNQPQLNQQPQTLQTGKGHISLIDAKKKTSPVGGSVSGGGGASQITMSLAPSNITIGGPTPVSMPPSTITITPAQPAASITLPTAPYPMPLYSNIPTNVVNPIQQTPPSTTITSSAGTTTNGTNQTVQSRPTNRVLPMQASVMLHKSPDVPQTPPPPPLKMLNQQCSEKLEEMAFIPATFIDDAVPPIASSPNDPADRMLKYGATDKPCTKRLEIEIKPIEVIPLSTTTMATTTTTTTTMSPGSQQHEQQQLQNTTPSFHFSLSFDGNGTLIPIGGGIIEAQDHQQQSQLPHIEIKPILMETDNLANGTAQSPDEQQLNHHITITGGIQAGDDLDTVTQRIDELKHSLEAETQEMLAGGHDGAPVNGCGGTDSSTSSSSGVGSPSLMDESDSPGIKDKISEILDNLEQQTNQEAAEMAGTGTATGVGGNMCGYGGEPTDIEGRTASIEHQQRTLETVVAECAAAHPLLGVDDGTKGDAETERLVAELNEEFRSAATSPSMATTASTVAIIDQTVDAQQQQQQDQLSLMSSSLFGDIGKKEDVDAGGFGGLGHHLSVSDLGICTDSALLNDGDAESVLFGKIRQPEPSPLSQPSPTQHLPPHHQQQMQLDDELQQYTQIPPPMQTGSIPKAPAVPRSSSPKLLYEIQSQDGFTYKSTSITEIWDKLFEAVQIARRAHGLSTLPEGQLKEMAGVQMLGLKTNAIRYLLEQLPGVEKCTQYNPLYHKKQSGHGSLGSGSGVTNGADSVANGDYFDDLKENAHGTARCEPYSSRSEYDMFSWLASRHRKQPMPIVAQSIDDTVIPRRGTGSNLPMAMRYRTLKESSKESVGVYRSHIHGRGLFCNRDIEAGEMVIEYAGELIRSTLTDKRERYYDGRGIGCYMFKIDENFVVDATMRGNAARFINHSCEPNCYSKVVDILGHKHIIIFALRRIVQGEELTYDYKFPFEDVKIPCSCGSKKCRKYLN